MSTSASQYQENPNAVPLPRGTACRACRRRKQKCSGERPICKQCTSGNRHDECSWDPTPLSKEEKLELRVRELEEQVAATWDRQYPGVAHEDELSLRADALLSPNEQFPPSSEVVEHLLDVFLAHSYQFNFPAPASLDFFKRSLQLDESNPVRPHHALIEAMCLLACRLSNRSLMYLEPYFLARATAFLDESLSMVDRLLDFIVATALVSRYSFYVGHDIRGTYMASSAVTFAVSCGLQCSSTSLAPNDTWISGARLMSPPETIEGLNHRNHAWWGVFLLDRDACNFMGLASSISEESITTAWPNKFGQYEDASIPTFPHVFVSNNIDAQQSAEDMLLYIKVKGSALLHQAASLARDPTRTEFGSFWPRQRILDNKINTFLASLPPVTATTLPLEPMLPGRSSSPSSPRSSRSKLKSSISVSETEATRYALLHAYSACFAARMQLHGVFAEELPSEYPLVVDAARGIVDLIRMTGKANLRTASFFVAPAWMTARRVLRRERERLRRDRMDVQTVDEEIQLLTSALDIHSNIFPGLKVYLNNDRD